MATRRHRIKYGFDSRITNLASATRNDFAAKTLYIPETSSRVFKRVYVDVWARQTDAAATSLTSWLIGIKLGAVAFDDVTQTGTLANSGEHTEWHFRREVTSYFSTNFGAGASQTCQVGVQFGAVGTINITVEVTIDYEFDDSSATTRIRTVQVPLDGPIALLTNSLVELGTNQLPQLTGGGILPESSITVRDWYLRITGNEKVAGTATDIALGLQIDADAEYTEGLRKQSLASSCFFTMIYSRTAAIPTTTTTHTLKARCAAATNRFMFGVVLVVTYEYDHSASTQIMNSIEVPLAPCQNDLIPQMTTATGNKHTFAKTLLLPEPGTLTIKQSGIVAYAQHPSAAANLNVTIAVNGGTARTYASRRISEVFAGTAAAFSHRCDGSVTLARGYNTIQVDVYSDATPVAGSVFGGIHPVLYLNYVSDKHTDGDGVHNHTVEPLLYAAEDGTAAPQYDSTLAAFSPPESSYHINGIGIQAHILTQITSLRSAWGGQFDSAEGIGSGWQPFIGNLTQDSNLAWLLSVTDASALMKAWTGDPRSNLMAPATSRLWRYVNMNTTGNALRLSASFLVTYHGIKWTQTFTDKNYPSGDGSGLEVTLHRDDTDEILLRGTTSPGGTVSFDWFDDTVKVYAQSYHGTQPTAYRGRSAAKLMSA